MNDMGDDVDGIFSQILHNQFHYFNFGRHALVHGIKLLELPAGSKILIPSFICRELLSVFHYLKFNVLYYEVTQSLSPALDPDGWPNADVVLAVNYFGFAQDLTPFFEYCKVNNAFLIEDNSHGFGSRDEYGIPLGTRGNIGLFSIRKTFPIFNGAAVFINSNIGYFPPINKFSKKRLNFKFIIKNLITFIDKKLNIPLNRILLLISLKLRIINTGEVSIHSDPALEFTLPKFDNMHISSLRYLSKISLTTEFNRRQVLYKIIVSSLSHLDCKVIFKDLDRYTMPYGVPFIIGDDVSDSEIAFKFAKMGLRCYRWPELPAQLGRNMPHFYTKIWWVNFL